MGVRVDGRCWRRQADRCVVRQGSSAISCPNTCGPKVDLEWRKVYSVQLLRTGRERLQGPGRVVGGSVVLAAASDDGL